MQQSSGSESPVITAASAAPQPQTAVKKVDIQKDAIPYNPDELRTKYPAYDFTSPPADQPMNMVDDPKEHFLNIKEVMMESPRLDLRFSENNVQLICQGISFRGSNAYFRLLIRNESEEDFLTGNMLLSWRQRASGGRLVPQRPVAVSDFPIVLPGKEISIVYVTRRPNITDDEVLYFDLGDRLKKARMQLVIPGKVYNEEKNR